MVWLTVRGNEPRKDAASFGIYKRGAGMAYHTVVPLTRWLLNDSNAGVDPENNSAVDVVASHNF